MVDEPISGLPDLGATLAAADLLAVVNDDSGLTEKVSITDFFANIPVDVSTSGALSVTNGNIKKGVQSGFSAGATQTQAGATSLVKDINVIATVGTTGDGVKLPTATLGLEILIINDGANAAQVWPNTSDLIDGGAANAADVNTLAVGEARRYVSVNASTWHTA